MRRVLFAAVLAAGVLVGRGDSRADDAATVAKLHALGPDVKEGLASHLEKRKPNFPPAPA